VQKFGPHDVAALLNVQSLGSDTTVSHRLLHARVRRLSYASAGCWQGRLLGLVAVGQSISRRPRGVTSGVGEPLESCLEGELNVAARFQCE
jgi:hypothetical protein